MSNHLPFYTQEPLEKWGINQHRKGLESELFATIPPKAVHWEDDHYHKWKIPLRKFIYKYTRDEEYSFNKKKVWSLKRAQSNLKIYKHKKGYRPYRVWAVLEDGNIITKDNIDQYDWKSFLYKFN